MRWSEDVNAFEDTKCSRSVVSDTLQSVTGQVRLLREKIDLLEAGHQLARADAIADLGKLLDACQNLRDAILSEDSAASWKTKEELHALVDRLDDVAAKRRRYLGLAQLLSAGTVVHRRERTRQERLALRDAAVAELMEISAQASLPDLPGPAIEEWLNWACSLEDGANDSELLNLKTNFPRVDDFIRQLEIELWHDGPAPIPGHSDNSSDNSIPVLHPQPGNSPASSHAEEATRDNDAPAQHIQTNTNQDPEESSPTSSAQATAVLVEQETRDLPPHALNSTQRGNLCFFAANELEAFSRYFEEAKGTRRKARKVRALLAISQWLLPREQNPVLHPGCGICAQIGYSETSDLVVVSPEDAAAAIDAEDALLLFAGGADLLRWSTTQASDKSFDGIASLRRLNVDQLRAWFVELFKIALSEPQVQDIYRLTFGVPLLVGEMHRLIIPVPDAPPTWLGYGIWTEMKARFQRRLPALGQDLRSGPPEVRLTNRELGLLKMILIASDYSTPDTIVSNLTDNWYQYHPPELPAMSSADERSVGLLQTLGLLPMRPEPGLGSIEAILPLEASDPVRQIISNL